MTTIPFPPRPSPADHSAIDELRAYPESLHSAMEAALMLYIIDAYPSDVHAAVRLLTSFLDLARRVGEDQRVPYDEPRLLAAFTRLLTTAQRQP